MKRILFGLAGPVLLLALSSEARALPPRPAHPRVPNMPVNTGSAMPVNMGNLMPMTYMPVNTGNVMPMTNRAPSTQTQPNITINVRPASNTILPTQPRLNVRPLVNPNVTPFVNPNLASFVNPALFPQVQPSGVFNFGGINTPTAFATPTGVGYNSYPRGLTFPSGGVGYNAYPSALFSSATQTPTTNTMFTASPLYLPANAFTSTSTLYSPSSSFSTIGALTTPASASLRSTVVASATDMTSSRCAQGAM